MNLNRINWANGMLISKEHFEHLGNYFEYKMNLIHSQIYGEELNYGLISIADSLPSLVLRIVNDEIALESLSALFNSGHFVQYDVSQYKVSLKLSEIEKANGATQGDYIIFTVLDENQFFIFGDADPSEFPPRLPWKNYELKLTCVALADYNTQKYGNNYLPVGYIKQNNGVFILHDQYIPPCLHVNAFPVLLEKFKKYQEELFSLYKNTLVCSQIARSSQKRGEMNDLAPSLQFVSERLTDFISDHLDTYNLRGTSLPTWEWYLIFKRMARNVYNSFACLKNMESQEVKNYLYQWTDTKPNDLTNALQTLLDDKYEQSFIHTNIVKIDTMMGILSKIFMKLKGHEDFRDRNKKVYESAETILNQESVKPEYKSPYSL